MTKSLIEFFMEEVWMSKLGYTWYPRDFASDPDVMLMSAEERGIYRDLMDLAYMTENNIKHGIEALVRYTNGTPDSVNRVLELKGEKINSGWKIPSCDKRIELINKNKNNGRKGGRPRNPNNNPEVNPNNNPEVNPNNNPDSIPYHNPEHEKTKPRQKGKEKEKEKDNIYRGFSHLEITDNEFQKLKDLGYSPNDIDSVLDAIENYKKNIQYKSLFLTAKNWLKDRKEKKSVEITSSQTSILDSMIPGN